MHFGLRCDGVEVGAVNMSVEDIFGEKVVGVRESWIKIPLISDIRDTEEPAADSEISGKRQARVNLSPFVKSVPKRSNRSPPKKPQTPTQAVQVKGKCPFLERLASIDQSEVESEC